MNSIQGAWLTAEDGQQFLIIFDDQELSSDQALLELVKFLDENSPEFPVIYSWKLNGAWTCIGPQPYQEEASNSDPRNIHVETILL